MATDGLCVGDIVCLYSEDIHGYVHAFGSSKIHSELAVSRGQDRQKPDVPDPQVISFQICVANRFKLNKKYRKLLDKSSLEPDNLTLKNIASQAKLASLAENDDNSTEQRRQHGKKVLYGQTVQLHHQFSGKFVHVSTTQTSKTESSNMQVELSEFNAKQAQFKIMPRYKVKAEGDVVQVDDQIVLESVKTPGQYLHVSKGPLGNQSIYTNCHELNLSVQQAGFTVYRRHRPQADTDDKLLAGAPIRLFHKEIEAYLVAEGLFDDIICEDVHLRVRAVDQNNPKTLFPSSSAITYWHIEMEEGVVSGGVIRWEQQCRIRHMTTRKYMVVNSNKQIALTSDHRDPLSVFRMHPVIKDSEDMTYESYCRIEHVVSGYWLHASAEEDYVSKQASHTSDTSMDGLSWTTAVLKTVSPLEEKQYDDAFTIQEVSRDLVEIFNYMSGMVPFIQKLIKDKKNNMVLNAKQTHDIVSALCELKTFMIVNSEPTKIRQKLVRNLRIVELLVNLLQLPYRHTKDQHHLTKIFVEAYDVLYTYLMGDSRKNELYIAKHIPFFQSQIEFEGEIGLNAAHMVMELIKDNRKIVDRITHEDIDKFVGLLKKNKNYRYLDLLSVLCVCDGVSIPDNQAYITKAWLMEGKQNCVFNTDLGNAIAGKKLDADTVYISTDNKRTWKALDTFANERENDTDEQFLFLEHQLDLYGKLCYGRNEFAIKVITEDLCYLTWKEAFLCLSSKTLPDQLKAKYCSLIIGMFVDVGENTSVLDRVTLTYVYDDVVTDARQQVTGLKDTLTPRGASSMKYFPPLRDWIEGYLDAHKDMTASLIGENMLIEQVLRLVHYLVKFGYYNHTDDITKLLGPLLSLVDGRNDKPYPHSKEADVQQVWENYRNKGRYEKSQENKAITDAKHQAMDVLDLFLNYRFNTRLMRFLVEFKSTHSLAMQPNSPYPELGPLLNENYELGVDNSVDRHALKKLKDMFDESAYFKGFSMTQILLDLSEYQYDKMVTMSMYLITRFYSAHKNLFDKAVQAQVLVTEKSCAVFEELKRLLPTLRRYATAKMSKDQVDTMVHILDALIGFCSLPDEPEEEHPMNQSILYNQEILSDLFDLLSQQIDVTLLEQYSGLQTVFQRCFKLMKAMARRNPVVQDRLFIRLDKILTIEGAEPEMADALTEVFTGNKETCMKILPYQVQKIMSLVAQHANEAPQFLDLLNAVVKVEELDLPLKRNQGYVMKYFMQYRSDVAYIIDQDPQQRAALLTGASSKDLQYMISLVDLLATCAEGENRFIESICQTIFSVDELLEIINNKNIDNNLKRPYLRFLLWVYLNTAGGMIESGSADLPHDTRVWDYMNGLNEELVKLSVFANQKSKDVMQFLKKAPSKGEMADSINDSCGQQASSSSTTRSHHHGSLHYVFDGVMPLLQVFFRNYYQPDREHHPKEYDYVDNLAKNLVTFVESIGPLISNETHLNTMVSCMNSVLSASTLPVKVMEEFQEKYGGGPKATDIRSEARKEYEEYYRGEEELNVQLNVYAVNYSYVYGGLNTVEHQLHYPIDKEYTDLEGDQVLPLGEEFQQLIDCFVDKSQNRAINMYRRAGKLVEQLSISASNLLMTEKERLEQEQLDLKCLQVLRAILHNEIIKLPSEWEDASSKANKKRLAYISESQNALNMHSAMLKAMSLLAKPGDDIVREVLAFMAAMLFAGNPDVQFSITEYFKGTREEMFFFAVKNRMHLSAIATKEKRALMAQHQAKLESYIEQAKALKRAMKDGRMVKAEIQFANKLGSTLMVSRLSMKSTVSKRGKSLKKRTSASTLKRHAAGGKNSLSASRSSLNRYGSQASRLNSSQFMAVPYSENSNVVEMSTVKKKKEDKIPLINNNQVVPASDIEVKVDDLNAEDVEELADMMSSSPDMEYKDEGYIELVLQVLGLMCDGQNDELQDYLREQPDNIKTVNLISEVSQFLGLVYSNINKGTIGLVSQLFSTLVEFMSGNLQNQAVVYDNKVCDYINYILRDGHFQGCTEDQVLALKEEIANLIQALIEENCSKDAAKKSIDVAREVVEALDVDVLFQFIIMCYQKAQNKDIDDDLRDSYMKLGFRFYHIISRMSDLDVENRCNRKVLVKTLLDEQAWESYSRATLSIEIVKENELQKLYFWVKDKTVLREEIKEKFKYEADRTSPSNKLRDFMSWSRDIMQDIKYQKRILANPVAKFFVAYWWHFNMAVLWLSLLIALIIMSTWTQPLDSTGNLTHDNPIPQHTDQNIPYVIYGLGGLHNLLSLCILLSYLLSNHPTFPTPTSIAKWFRTLFSSRSRGQWKEKDDDDSHKSNLEVTFFSFKTFYILIFFALSIMGTVFHGYFFAFHLLHIVENNQLLSRVSLAITRNGKSLLWVGCLGLIVFYIYTLIAFGFYRELFNSAKGYYCTTMYECFVTVLHRGLIVGTYEFFEEHVPEDKSFQWHALKTLYDISFFIIITTIGLNIIFGIIVDTFSELRDSKWQIDNDMTTTCFICSRNSYDFEHHGGGFEHHVKQEHNQWAYLFFFIHLEETRSNDYNALELYVSRLLRKENYNFFPLNRALSLVSEDDDKEHMLETLMSQVTYLVNRMKEEEAAIKKEEEKKHQEAWKERNRAAIDSTVDPYSSGRSKVTKTTHKARVASPKQRPPSAKDDHE